MDVALAPLSVVELSSSYDVAIVVRRWAATLVDFIVLIAPWFVIANLDESLQMAAFVVWSLATVAYYPVLEGLLGATLGKLVLDLRIVDENGRRAGWGQVMVRTLLRLIEVNPLLFGGLPAGLFVMTSKERQRLGDKLARTYVVRKSDLGRLTPAALPDPQV
jgi:uncharacterized RDD family membrane protein YckC